VTIQVSDCAYLLLGVPKNMVISKFLTVSVIVLLLLASRKNKLIFLKIEFLAVILSILRNSNKGCVHKTTHCLIPQFVLRKAFYL
jgi:hypothetical protein